jgi:hypothetical protein
MTDFSPSNFLNELYKKHYLKYLTDHNIHPKAPYTNYWCFEETTLGFAASQLSFIGTNDTNEENHKKHFELLRLLIYNACKYFRRKNTAFGRNYIKFIKDILWILLEQESISFEYEVNSIEYSDPPLYYYPDPSLHSLLLSIPQLYDIFYDNRVHFIRISNSSVHTLLSEMNKNICDAIENHVEIANIAKTAKTAKTATSATTATTATTAATATTATSATTDTTAASSSTRSTIYKTRKYTKYRKYRKAQHDTTSAQGRKKKSRKKKRKKERQKNQKNLETQRNLETQKNKNSKKYN